jgi:hypothetical protein
MGYRLADLATSAGTDAKNMIIPAIFNDRLRGFSKPASDYRLHNEASTVSSHAALFF